MGPAEKHAFPKNPLFPYIDRLWSWELPPAGNALPVQLLPGTGCELLFHFGGPFLLEAGEGRIERLSGVNLVALRHRMILLSLPPGSGFLSVRFRAGALRHFCGVSMEHLTDTLLDAYHLWGGETRVLEERVGRARSFRERCRIVEEWLRGRLQAPCGRERAVDWAIRRMYYDYSHVSLDGLAECMGVGTRHFQRIVKAGVGMSPKEHVRLSRFQHAVKAMLLDGGYDLERALGDGFYDQSHFIREFRGFSGESPGGFLRASRGRSHFYNTSRPDNVILKDTKSYEGGFRE